MIEDTIQYPTISDLPSRAVVTCLVSRPHSDSEPNASHQTGSWAIQDTFS